VCDFRIGAALGELLDRISAIPQYAFLPIDEGYSAFARRGVHERGIVAHQSEVFVRDFYLPQVHRPNHTVFNRNLVLRTGPVVCDHQGISTHISSLDSWGRPQPRLKSYTPLRS